MSVFIIAEAGVNHNGRLDLALELVEAAAEMGADAIKFQTFKAESLVTETAQKADYQKNTTDGDASQLEMLRELELSIQEHEEIYAFCQTKSISYLSTAFDQRSLEFLAGELELNTLKIASGEMTNAPLLLQSAKTGSNLIMSTGMCTLGEIEEALSVVAFGMISGALPQPSFSKDSFQQAFSLPAAQELLRKRVTLLHCTTEYPASFDQINLRALKTMKSAFGLEVGYSDHSIGISVPLAAVALGASIIEKHFTLDKSMPGPDHLASLEPREFGEMVRGIREIEMSLGHGVKVPLPSELTNRSVVRKSLVAARDIREGELFSEENLVIKRPGAGISPMRYWDILGSACTRDIKKDEVV